MARSAHLLKILAAIISFAWLAPAVVPTASAGAPPEESWLAERLARFQDLKFGFMMHWGAYSQWGCIESWPLVEEDRWARPDDLKAWIERGKNIDRFRSDYWAATHVQPDPLRPARWRNPRAAGMKYVVFTTKHHDGFCMFDTKQTDYRVTAPDVPFHTHPRADVARAVFDAFRKEQFAIGVYFSKADWHHPDYWDDSTPAAQTPTMTPSRTQRNGPGSSLTLIARSRSS